MRSFLALLCGLLVVSLVAVPVALGAEESAQQDPATGSPAGGGEGSATVVDNCPQYSINCSVCMSHSLFEKCGWCGESDTLGLCTSLPASDCHNRFYSNVLCPSDAEDVAWSIFAILGVVAASVVGFFCLLGLLALAVFFFCCRTSGHRGYIVAGQPAPAAVPVYVHHYHQDKHYSTV